jgi:hypothetical protein
MKSPAILLSLIVLLQDSSGCNNPPAATPAPQGHYQRFIPVNNPPAGMQGVPWTGYFALDTKTGLLCLTVDDFIPKNFPNTPTCLKLMSEWPDK